MTPLPKRERCGLRRVAGLKEPEPLSHQSVSTTSTSPEHADHRHIRPNIKVTRILVNTGRRLADPRVCDIAQIRVVLNLGAECKLSRP